MIQTHSPSVPPQPSLSTEPKPRRRARQTKQPSKAASRGPKGFEFISSDSGGKPAADTRKFIRSHVMRGKNTGKRSAVYPAPESSSRDNEENRPADKVSSSLSPPRTSTADGRPPPFAHRNSCVIVPGDHGTWSYVAFPWAFPAPLGVPNDLALVNLPQSPDHETQKFLHRFFTAIKETMYPVEWCFRPDCMQSCWFQWLFVDLAYYYSTLFVVSAFQDIFKATQEPASITPSSDLSKRFSGRTTRYLRLAIELLQKRLDSPELRLEDVTIATVVSLAMVADAVGDVEGAKAHVSGLKQMVRMRGGVKGMMSNRHVLAKIFRVDLGYSIKYGERPEFVDDDLSWDPFLGKMIDIESPIPPSTTLSGINGIVESLDPKLRNVFYDLRSFSSVADGLVASKKKLRPELFQEIMTSIQYRLLLLSYSLETHPIEEAVRLGLLAFQTSVFLQMHGTKLKYDFISNELTNALDTVPETSPVYVQLKTWLAFIGAIAVLDFNQPWLVAIIRRLTLNSSWAETRSSLQDIMWIGVIHDGAGKQIYDGARVIDDTVHLGLRRFWSEFLGVE